MTNKFTQYKKNTKLNSKKHENHFCVFFDKFSVFFITILFLYSLFSILNFNPLTRELVNPLIINTTYALESTQAQLDQTASILSSIQGIINKLKIEIQELFGREAKAAVETIGLVRQDCTGYSNCFTSLSAWEAAYGGINFGACAVGDLVCADKIAIAQIDGAWTNPDTNSVLIDGWTTDATHYIRIYTTTAARHSGKWDTGKYRLQIGGAMAIYLVENYVRIEGLQIYITSANQGIYGNWLVGGGSETRISHSIIRGSGSSSGVSLWGIFNTAKVWNNIIYDFAIGIEANITNDVGNGPGYLYVYNTTVQNCIDGYLRYAYTIGVVKNSISQDCTNGFSDVLNGDYNLSDIASDAPGANSRNGVIVTFVDKVNDDFHISSSDTSAKDAGANLSADANLAFSDDIDGNTRPVGSAWDIGADEESTVAPPPTDTTPPTLSSGSPTGSLPVGTTQTILSVSTLDENSTCKYGIVANTVYASITDTFTTTGGTAHSQTITGLTNGTSYNYYVRCQDTASNPNTTDYTISFSVSSPTGDTTPPVVSITSPINGTTVSGTITISANATDNTGIAGVQFKLDTNTFLGTEDITSPYSYSLNTTTITDGSHTLTTVARDTSNNFATSSAITITINNASPPPPDTTAPSIPTGLTATAISSSQINLSWTASTDNVAVTGYKIYRCTGSACAPTTQIATSTTNSYSNTGLTASTAYTYAVSAYDAAGNESLKSTSASATTQTQTGNIYYVSPTGSTSWPDCTSEDSPCLADSTSTGKQFLVASAGDTVYFLPGIYNPGNAPGWTTPAWNPANSGVAGKPITFKCLTPVTCTITHNTVGPSFGSATKNYITWDGFKSTKVSNQPIVRFGADHGILRNCEFMGFDYTTDGDNNPFVAGGGQTNTLIQNNYFHDLTGLGHNTAAILLYSATNVIIEKNSFVNNTLGIYDKNNGQNNTFRLNFFYNNHESFLTKQDAGGPGTTNRYIYQNIFVDTNNQESDTISQQDYPYTSTNIQFYNNTIYKPLGTTGHYTYVMQQITNSHFWNNIVYGVGWIYHNAYSNDGKPTYMDYNIYYNAQKFYAGGSTKTSLADWQVSGLLLGGGNPDVNSYYEDPQFVNAGGISPADYKSSATYKNNGRGGSYTSVIGAYITGDEQIGYSSPEDTPPTPPTSLTATAISSFQINLSWTASTDNVGVTGYKIYRCAGSGCTPTIQIATSATNSYSNTSLTPSTAYTYAVSAYDAAGNESAKSSSVSATTQAPTPECSDGIDNDNDGKIDFGGSNPDPDCSSLTDNSESDTIPPIISSVISTTLASTTVRINWTTNEPGTSQVEYGFTTQYGASTTLDTTLLTSHSVLLSNLSPDNTTYNYRVRSKDSLNNEAISTNNTFITPGLTDIIPPASTTNLTANNITQTSVDLVTWTAAGDDGNSGTAFSFDIRYTTGELTENTWNNASVIRATGEPTPRPAGSLMNYTLLGLTPNTTYKAALKTLDESLNQSPVSNIITFTTLAAPTTPPTTPGGGGGGGSSSGGGGGGGGGGGSFILSDTTPPPQITELESQGADKQVRLIWKNPESTDYVRTIIIRKEWTFATSSSTSSLTTLHATSTKDGTIIYEGTDKEFIDTKLKNNETYYYSIFTMDRVPNYSLPATTTAKTQEGKTSFETLKKEQIIPLTGQEGENNSKTIKTSFFTIKKGTFKRTLKFGMRGKDVKILQEALFQNKEEFYPQCQPMNSKFQIKCSKKEIITGYFGKQTKDGLIKFQEKHKIMKKGTGVLNKKTIKKIYELYPENPKSTVQLKSKITDNKTKEEKNIKQTDNNANTNVKELEEQLKALKVKAAELIKKRIKELKRKR